MTGFNLPKFNREGGPPPVPPGRRGSGGGGGGGGRGPGEGPPTRRIGPVPLPDWFPRSVGSWVLVLLALAVVYGGYVWFVKRVVVGADEVLVLMKKYGDRSLPDNQVVMPDPVSYPGGKAAWDKDFADCNGIFEQVYLTGTYFGFSPFDYERDRFKIVEVPTGQVGLVVRKFGKPLPAGQVLAGPGQRGPLAETLQPGKYPAYSNPYAYEVKLVDPVHINPGYRGVVTVMAGNQPAQPNDYLVGKGEQGVQPDTEPEGFRYVNLYERRITPVSVKSHRFEMARDAATGEDDSIQFPSSDSFQITMEGFVEWSIVPDRLPLTYVQYSEGAELVKFLEEKVILPYARSFSRIVGSRYTAREFITGETKLQFQQEFATHLTNACKEQGILVHQALVRDILPPDAIRDPINEREVARQTIKTLEEQIKVARSQADLARQQAMAEQNKAVGGANTQVVGIVKKAEQLRDVAITKAQQELAVAKLRLEASQKQAEAIVARGTAEANVVLLQKQAEAEPLRQQIEAFGDGNAYARFFFYQQVAPSMKTILTNTEGPFADVFKQFAAPALPAPAVAGPRPTTLPSSASASDNLTGVQQ